MVQNQIHKAFALHTFRASKKYKYGALKVKIKITNSSILCVWREGCQEEV